MNHPMQSREAAECIEAMKSRLSESRRENQSTEVCKWAGVILVAALALALLSGCAHKAAHFDAPDSTALHAKREELAQHVRTSRLTLHDGVALLTEEQAKVRAAEIATSKVKVIEGEIAPKLADLRMRVTVELQPEVDALSAQLAELAVQSGEASAALTEAAAKGDASQKKFAEADGHAAAAQNVAAEISSKYGPDYERQAGELAVAANQAETGWHEADAERIRFKTQIITHRILGILGGLGVAALAFLYFTGRITAKIP